MNPRPGAKRSLGTAPSGQALAELALVAPMLVALTLGVIQLGLLGYAAAVTRFAAFAGLRSAAVAGVADRQGAARTAATAVIACAPGLRLVGVSVTRVPLPLRGTDAARERMACRLLVRAPRLLPILPLRPVQGSAVMPMEPGR